MTTIPTAPDETTLLTFNVGSSIKSNTVRWDKAADAIAEYQPALIGLTEASNRNKLQHFATQIGQSTHDDGARFRLYYHMISKGEYVALLYDTAVFDTVPVPAAGASSKGLAGLETPLYHYAASNYGKYIHTRLQRRDDDTILNAVVSHLPYRTRRQTAVVSFGRDVADAIHNQPSCWTLGMGDYNKNPEHFRPEANRAIGQRVDLSLQDCSHITTQGGNTYDNFFSLPPAPAHQGATRGRDQVRPAAQARSDVGAGRRRGHHSRRVFCTQEVLPSMYGSDHYPIVTTCAFD